MLLLILSDIHANLSALTAVLEAVRAGGYGVDRAILLGDHIDYGMRPNEVIRMLMELPYPVDVNIWGNHEKAILDFETEGSRFASQRGRAFSQLTARMLDEHARRYILYMDRTGKAEREYDGKRYLFVHGSLEDVFWKSITPDTPGDAYAAYDVVVSGHSHLPHYFERYFPADNPVMRNKKKTVFLNPGSVGQPRNHNPNACFALLDTVTGQVHLNAVPYPVEAEQRLYEGQPVDPFYRDRLRYGV